MTLGIRPAALFFFRPYAAMLAVTPGDTLRVANG